MSLSIQKSVILAIEDKRLWGSHFILIAPAYLTVKQGSGFGWGGKTGQNIHPIDIAMTWWPWTHQVLSMSSYPSSRKICRTHQLVVPLCSTQTGHDHLRCIPHTLANTATCHLCVCVFVLISMVILMITSQFKSYFRLHLI